MKLAARLIEKALHPPLGGTGSVQPAASHAARGAGITADAPERDGAPAQAARALLTGPGRSLGTRLKDARITPERLWTTQNPGTARASPRCRMAPPAAPRGRTRRRSRPCTTCPRVAAAATTTCRVPSCPITTFPSPSERGGQRDRGLRQHVGPVGLRRTSARLQPGLPPQRHRLALRQHSADLARSVERRLERQRSTGRGAPTRMASAAERADIRRQRELLDRTSVSTLAGKQDLMLGAAGAMKLPRLWLRAHAPLEGPDARCRVRDADANALADALKGIHAGQLPSHVGKSLVTAQRLLAGREPNKPLDLTADDVLHLDRALNAVQVLVANAAPDGAVPGAPAPQRSPGG
ncbi:hypothetical protein Ddc_23937 [Ditylenchus destructor]|nr:hypothetical protein Ddc_23937 [Ditylenchus destructor]